MPYQIAVDGMILAENGISLHRLVGMKRRMALEATSLSPKTTRLSYSPSKERLLSDKVQRPAEISSTIIACSGEHPQRQSTSLTVGSCCCARVSPAWAFSTVCDCYSSGWGCTQSCLEQSLQDDDLYYNIGIVRFSLSLQITFDPF